jgi:hypothetical protein
MNIPFLEDISKFDKISDYLPILNAALIVDLVGIFGTFKGYIDSSTLKIWYKKYHIMALIADVLSIVIGIILARFFYHYIFSSFHLLYFIGLAVSIQIFHDLLFYTIFQNTPVGHNAMLDFFKKYAKDVGYNAIIGDSAMIIATCILASIFIGSLSANANIIMLVFLCYLVPYFLNYE